MTETASRIREVRSDEIREEMWNEIRDDGPPVSVGRMMTMTKTVVVMMRNLGMLFRR